MGGLAIAGCTSRSASLSQADAAAPGYGPLVPDPAGLLDLPVGFSYRVLSQFGDPMNDGGAVPDRADGMGSIALPGGRHVLVRNHELAPRHIADGALRGTQQAMRAFDRLPDGRRCPGGTTTLVSTPTAP